jgi:hypothetical protein
MKKTFYEKVGRQYKPVYEYDSEFIDSFPDGCHLIVCKPGETSRRYNIDPAFAPMIAAGLYAQNAISDSMIRASELRPSKLVITEEQRQAWEALAKAFGDELCTLQGASIHDIAQAGVDAMIQESKELLKNPAVQKAYEHFLLVAKLVGEKDEQKN